MNIAIEELSACRRRLSIEVPTQKVEEETNRVLDEFQKYASIKGFRPGKAPRKMVASRYRKDIESEMKRSLVPKAFREAVKEKDLDIVNSPDVEDLKYEPGVSLSFTTTFDLAPEFELPQYKAIKVKKEDSGVTDEDVQEVVKSFMEQRADYNDITDRSLQEGDFAVITYEGTVDGKPLSELAPDIPNLEKQEKFWLWIKDDVFLPDFGKQLIGSKPGDEKEVAITFPDDFPQEPLRGKKAEYKVQIEGIKEKVIPDLTDEIAQEVAQTSKDELLKIVRGNLENQKQEKARNEHTRQLLDHLKSSVQFDLPESSVEEEKRNVISDIIRENQQRGIPEHVMEEHKQDILNNAETSAKDRVRINFILSRVAKAESLEVSDSEMAMELQRLSQQFQIPPDKLFKRLEENGAILRLQDDILRRKTIDFLLQSAEIA